MLDGWTLTAIIFGLYCTTSFLFRLKPEIIHKVKGRRVKYTKDVSCLHISHRGGAAENLENTMEAFDHAAAIGTDMFEIDCHITKDGYVVVAHDNNLLRTCGEDILISETNYADLPLLLCTQMLHFMKGYTLTKNVVHKKRKILLLEDLFEKYPNMLINIDIKFHSLKLISSVAELVKKYQREEQTIWGNSSTAISKSVRALNTNIRTIYNMNEVIKTFFLYCTGLLPFVPIYADYLEIPLFEIFYDQIDIPTSTIMAPFIRILIFILNCVFANEKLLTHLRKRGVSTFYFVLNTEQNWKRAYECGTAGIMTDFPSSMKLWMQSYADQKLQ